MIDVGRYSLVLDVEAARVAPWLRPVLEAGRDAAFVDTGYLRALLDERDDRHGAVGAFHMGLSASLYTSSLVVTEAARQFAKASNVSQAWCWGRVEQLADVLSYERGITICSPPTEVIHDALGRLKPMQRVLGGLDLCDLVSMLVLDGLSHRRVLGFDNHFRAVGAALEP
jgi:predicted nucleic acid-binding protein